MSDTDTQTIPQPAAEEITQQPAKTHTSAVWLAIGALVLTLIAWISCYYSGICAVVLSAIAIVMGAFALRSHKRSVRNTAITAIIAAAVLLVVVAAFMIVINMGLKSVGNT